MPACPSCGADIARIGAACLRCGRSVDPAHEPTRSAPFANGLPATGPVAGTLVAGRYRVERPLGRGGMGVVLLARDESLDRRVALKLLSSEAARDDTARRRFAREARAVAALDHPFICKLYDVDDSTEPPFLVLEYIDGEVLGARLRREPLPAAEAWRLAAEIADALRRAHAAGIVHRDLKPGNVILTPDGHAKVTDFGLARRVEPDSDDPDATAVEALTRTGGLTGTPSFMAPEQLRAEPADARSDQFALGLVIFEMVAGAHPFRRSALADTIGAILRDPAPPLSSAAAGVTRDEDRVVARLLAKRPEDRFADSEQVHAALSAAAAARAAGGPPSSDRSTSRLRRSVAAVVATALVAVLAAVWLVSREPSEARPHGQQCPIAVDVPGLPQRRDVLARRRVDRLRRPGGRCAADLEAPDPGR